MGADLRELGRALGGLQQLQTRVACNGGQVYNKPPAITNQSGDCSGGGGIDGEGDLRRAWEVQIGVPRPAQLR